MPRCCRVSLTSCYIAHFRIEHLNVLPAQLGTHKWCSDKLSVPARKCTGAPSIFWLVQQHLNISEQQLEATYPQRQVLWASLMLKARHSAWAAYCQNGPPLTYPDLISNCQQAASAFSTQLVFSAGKNCLSNWPAAVHLHHLIDLGAGRGGCHGTGG